MKTYRAFKLLMVTVWIVVAILGEPLGHQAKAQGGVKSSTAFQWYT
jgi:hypothetical protein